MRISRRKFAASVAVLISISSVGCTTFNKKTAKNDDSFFDRLPFVGKGKADEPPEPYPNPAKMAATWTPDTLVQTGRTPTRGFGGRVFFYDEKSRAVPVEGTLIVHGFDDSKSESGDPSDKNAKRFEFTPEQFTRHFSQTDLGASYSVWIPWDAIGGSQRRVSLVTSFKTVEGKLIQGIPATVQLPGTTEPKTREDELAGMSPQYRQFRQAAGEVTPKSGLTTTTISRRRLPGQSEGAPGINVPGKPGVPATMVAGSNETPSVDIQMMKRAARPTSSVMPASATLPDGW
ncbi:hypothetical protein K227x_59710 [Rubripirellula lacrimiformis]|uniref:Uncharacterized protein n=1 Tax=Rubripirellula lacrimiformis TaxID=1930273 RepID=A0A517NKH9_9BACT|nr:hypothetical protein [Rubripirellula lacrimiformis]QDT07543.1 hypothetical protein K227x_59710 [Rubripirellula lacrimiformis]